MELCVADVDLQRAPREAVDDFLANRAPPAEKPRRERGRRLRRSDYHAWMMEKER